jgi:hypothetical protein
MVTRFCLNDMCREVRCRLSYPLLIGHCMRTGFGGGFLGGGWAPEGCVVWLVRRVLVLDADAQSLGLRG